MDVLAPTESVSILDVGVANSGYDSPGRWATEDFFEAWYPWPHRITAVSLHEFTRSTRAYPAVRCVKADGRELPFRDHKFEIVFSNAVVEQVGDRQDQLRFIEEACRVARKLFITTPKRLFPIEVHTRPPVVHWLPKRQRNWVFRRLDLRLPCHLELLSPRSGREASLDGRDPCNESGPASIKEIVEGRARVW